MGGNSICIVREVTVIVGVDVSVKVGVKVSEEVGVIVGVCVWIRVEFFVGVSDGLEILMIVPVTAKGGMAVLVGL